MGTRLDDATSLAWDVLAKLQVTRVSNAPGTPLDQRPFFWVGQLEGTLAILLDAIREEGTNVPRA